MLTATHSPTSSPTTLNGATLQKASLKPRTTETLEEKLTFLGSYMTRQAKKEGGISNREFISSFLWMGDYFYEALKSVDPSKCVYLKDLKVSLFDRLPSLRISEQADWVANVRRCINALDESLVRRLMALTHPEQWAGLIYLIRTGLAAQNFNRTLSQLEDCSFVDYEFYKQPTEAITVNGKTFHCVLKNEVTR